MWSQTVIDSIATILTNISSAWLIWIGYRYRTFTAEKRSGSSEKAGEDTKMATPYSLTDIKVPKAKHKLLNHLYEFWTWHKK